MFYGLSDKHQIAELAQAVCAVLGDGNGFAVSLLVETCAAETLLGKARDNTLYGAGAGVSQVDYGTFAWLQEKYTPRDLAARIFDVFNIDLGLVAYKELDFSPLLSLIFCRLRYMTVTAPIPTSLSLRAEYWKEHYNTSAGKGTPEEYISRCLSSGAVEVLTDAK